MNLNKLDISNKFQRLESLIKSSYITTDDELFLFENGFIEYRYNRENPQRVFIDLCIKGSKNTGYNVMLDNLKIGQRGFEKDWDFNETKRQRELAENYTGIKQSSIVAFSDKVKFECVFPIDHPYRKVMNSKEQSIIKHVTENLKLFLKYKLRCLKPILIKDMLPKEGEIGSADCWVGSKIDKLKLNDTEINALIKDVLENGNSVPKSIFNLTLIRKNATYNTNGTIKKQYPDTLLFKFIDPEKADNNKICKFYEADSLLKTVEEVRYNSNFDYRYKKIDKLIVRSNRIWVLPDGNFGTQNEVKHVVFDITDPNPIIRHYLKSGYKRKRNNNEEEDNEYHQNKRQRRSSSL